MTLAAPPEGLSGFLQVFRRSGTPKPPKLKMHGQFWEHARPVLVVIGSSAMTGIGAYVIAKESIDRVLTRHAQGADVLIVVLTVALGMMLDAAIIISGTRITMHTQRFRKEWFWCILAFAMFFVCLGAEAMTLAYFYKVIEPDTVPKAVAQIIDGIHDLLYFFRAGLPPLIVAYLAIAVKALTFERSDRKQQMKADTSVRLMVLENELARPVPEGGDLEAATQRKRQILKEYETQLVLNQYATGATTNELAEDTHLVAHFQQIWGEPTAAEMGSFVTKEIHQADQTTLLATMQAAIAEANTALLGTVQAAIAEALAASETRMRSLLTDLQSSWSAGEQDGEEDEISDVDRPPPDGKWRRNQDKRLRDRILEGA